LSKDLFKGDARRPSAVEVVVETMNRLLRERKLKAGDLIPSEKVLSESLAISRGSIREAMKILSAFGVVDIRRGDGTYVGTSPNAKLLDPLLFRLLVSDPELAELVELRFMVEVGIAKLLIEHAGDADIKRLSDLCDEMEAALSGAGRNREILLGKDLEFHTAMAAITGNKLVTTFYNFVIELYAPTMHPDVEGVVALHRKIIDAVAARDFPRAVEAVQAHAEFWRRTNTGDLAATRVDPTGEMKRRLE
jgi:GntR family transcriptional repressor for pyruvate dehydrogenase complex